jgi:hypothetical protein
MQPRPVVAAYGHIFSNLELETELLALTGCAPRSQIQVPS